MRFRACLPLILALLTLSLPVQASSFYPIQTGRTWDYSGPNGASSSAMMGSQETFDGSLVYPMQWTTGVSELYSVDGTGRVFRHGVKSTDGSYIVHNPISLFMDSDLTPGHTWVSDHEDIHYDAADVEVARDQWHESFEVIGVQGVTVPAGTFTATEILHTAEKDGQPYTTFHDFFAEGVGWIKRTNADGSTVLFELDSYGPSSVATEFSSWGRVKTIFQN